MKSKAVILDWSGVISDDLDYVSSIVNMVRAVHYDLPAVDKKTQKEYLCLNFVEFWRAIGVAAEMKVIQSQFDALMHYGNPKPKLIPGVKETLKYLRKKEKQAAVISAHNNVHNEMKDYGIEGYFTEVLSHVDKSSPEKYCKAIDEVVDIMGVSKDSVVLVEDMVIGVRAGNFAGVCTVALANPLYGYHSEDRLIKENPDHLIRDIRDLENIIS